MFSRLLFSILFVTVLLSFYARPGIAFSPLVLSSAPCTDLAGNIEMLVDSSGTLTLADILSPAYAGKFRPVPGNLNASYTRDTIWARIRILREATFPEDAWLRLGPPYLNLATVYYQTGADPFLPLSYRVIRLGDHIPVAERPVQAPEFIAPITLTQPPGVPATMYVRLASTSVINLEGSIHTTSDIVSHNTTYLLAQGGYLGIAIVIALVNFIYFFRIRDYLFLAFSGYIFSLGLNHTGTTGLITVLWPSTAHILSDYLTGSGTGLAMFVFSLFAIKLFNTKRHTLLHGYFLLMCTLSILTILSVPFDFYGLMARIIYIGALLMIIIMTRLSITLIRNKEPGGMLYLAAFGISNIGYAVHFLRLLGLLPLNVTTQYGIQFGTLINMVLMSLALTERVRAAEEKSLVAAREAEGKAVELAQEMTVELRDEREKLKEALENQIQFVDMVSHEYRTPLAIIKTNLDILRDNGSDSLLQTESIGIMQRAVTRLVEVVETSFGVSCLAESGISSQQEERIEVADFLAEVCDEAMALWPGVALNLPPDKISLTFILAGRSLLKTALFNLIDNAVKYGGREHPVDIILKSDDQKVLLVVADHGPMITDGELDELRRKFKRGRNALQQEGTGIGLYLVDRIVAKYGGSLQFFPNVPHGTRAVITLPCYP